jgi:multicomponent Na+:H+ antiporter subunit D
MLPMVADQTPVVAALILMVVGIGIKAALFPMYGWLPESYTHANATSSALIAPIGTKVAAYVMIRIVLFLFGEGQIDRVIPVTSTLGILAGIGILFGSLMAISQTNLKRMLAFSSVSQIGYILMGVSLMNPIGFAGAVFHVLSHAVMKSCLFLVSANIERSEGHCDLSRFDDTYRKKYPVTMAMFTIAAISMIGLPPMAGFFSKWALALGTIENGNIFLFVVILASSLLNAVYFFRILERVYLKKPESSAPSDAVMNESPWGMLIPVSVLGIGLIVAGFLNAPLLTLIQSWYPVG